MKLATIQFLQKLLTSDQLTLRGNQISSVAIAMQELHEEEMRINPTEPTVPVDPVPPKPTGKVVRKKGK